MPLIPALSPGPGDVPGGTWILLLAIIAIVGLGVVLTISIRGRVAQRNARQPSAREQIEQIKAASRRRDDVERHSADLLDLAQRLSAQLDNKAERLEQLCAEAEQRTSALIDALEQSRPGEPAASGEAGPDSPAPPRGPNAVAEDGGTVEAPRPPRADLDPLSRSVYELADAGRTPVQIACELDEQVGKVELILALRAG